MVGLDWWVWPLGAWLLVELAAQTARLGWFRVWWLEDVPGRCGVTFHPWLILVDAQRCVEHEKWHGRQQARWTWLLWMLLYALRARFRLRQEIEATIRSLSDEQLALPQRHLRPWVQGLSKSLTDDTYFGRWWQPGRNPGRAWAAVETWREIHRERGRRGG